MTKVSCAVEADDGVACWALLMDPDDMTRQWPLYKTEREIPPGVYRLICNARGKEDQVCKVQIKACGGAIAAVPLKVDASEKANWAQDLLVPTC